MDIDKISKKLRRAGIYTTNNLQIEGRIFIRSEIRLSDELNMSGRYIVVKDASVKVQGAEKPITREFVFVNKDQIVYVYPLE